MTHCFLYCFLLNNALVTTHDIKRFAYYNRQYASLSRPSGQLVNLWHKLLTTLRATLVLFLCTLVLQMGISCCAMLILCLNHIRELQLFLFYSLSSFSTFSFYVFVTLDSPISFLGCLYSLC